MKVLLLSVALLFFTGAQGHYFWQRDELIQEQSYNQVIERILEDGISMINDVFNDLDLREIAKEYHITEAWEAAEEHAEKLEKSLERYFEELWKRFDGHLNEKFPVFRQKMVPILEEFEDNIEKQIEKVLNEAVPVGSDLVSGIRKHVVHFFESLESIAEKGRDSVRAEIDSLRVQLHPYVNDVHAEYERYQNNLQDELQKDVKELKDDVQKKVEKFMEHAKPVIENIRKKLPDGKELQEHIGKLLEEFKEYVESLE